MAIINFEKMAQNKFNHLLLVQFLLYLLMPVQNAMETRFPFSILLLLSATTFTLYVVLETKKFLFALVVAAAAFGATVLLSYDVIPASITVKTAVYCLYIIFFIFTIIALIMKISSGATITNDSIKGGISIYMQLTMLWAIIYMLIWTLEPGSFANISGDPALDTFYYSLVTITTIGYGDITPLSHWAKMLSGLEAFAGQIYLAIFVAKIVAMSVMDRPAAETSSK